MTNQRSQYVANTDEERRPKCPQILKFKHLQSPSWENNVYKIFKLWTLLTPTESVLKLPCHPTQHDLVYTHYSPFKNWMWLPETQAYGHVTAGSILTLNIRVHVSLIFFVSWLFISKPLALTEGVIFYSSVRHMSYINIMFTSFVDTSVNAFCTHEK